MEAGAQAAPDAVVRELLETLADALGIEATVEVEEHDGTVTGRLEGEDVALFIGRHGHTIDAVQHLAQRIAFPGGPPTSRIVIDAAGYRERREAALHTQADAAAEEALRFDRPVGLDAMPPAERRVLHEYLRARGDVETYSEGEEPDRHLIVAPLDE
jgi:spoIIIJ-associated protein